MINVSTNFQLNSSKTVGRGCETKLQVFCTQTDTQTDGHKDRRTKRPIPVYP